jgi:hypothetical protein
MNKTNRLTLLSSILLTALLVPGCAMEYKEKAQAVEAQPVNCATAEGDLRVLKSEKAHVVQQIGMGVSAISPYGLALGVLTGTEGTKLKVATGEYNDLIDRKIAEIQETCGVQ